MHVMYVDAMQCMRVACNAMHGLIRNEVCQCYVCSGQVMSGSCTAMLGSGACGAHVGVMGQRGRVGFGGCHDDDGCNGRVTVMCNGCTAMQRRGCRVMYVMSMGSCARRQGLGMHRVMSVDRAGAGCGGYDGDGSVCMHGGQYVCNDARRVSCNAGACISVGCNGLCVDMCNVLQCAMYAYVRAYATTTAVSMRDMYAMRVRHVCRCRQYAPHSNDVRAITRLVGACNGSSTAARSRANARNAMHACSKGAIRRRVVKAQGQQSSKG